MGMVEDTAREIVEAAKMLLDESSSTTAYTQLIGSAYSLVDRGIASVAEPYDGRVDAEEILTRFLKDKIDSPKFLTGIVGAGDAAGYVVQAAKNFTRDCIRSNPPVVFANQAIDPQEGGRELFIEDRRSAEEVIVASQEQERRMRWIGDLPVDDQLLMHVLYAEALELPAEMVDLLAKRRVIESTELLEELEARASAQQGKRTEWEHELNKRSETIHAVQHRLRVVDAMISEVDFERAKVPAQLSSERREELRQSQTALREASAQERSGYMAHLGARLDALSQLQHETRTKLARDLPAGKQYEEVLAILGQLPDAEADQKKAINAITARVLRIRKRMRQWLASNQEEV